MGRCGCTDSCSCMVTAGTGATVTGNGSAGNPYVVSAVGGGGGSGTGFRHGTGARSVIGGDLDTPATAAGADTLSIGDGTIADGDHDLAIGNGAEALPTAFGRAIAIGPDAIVALEGDSALALGDSALARMFGDVVIGQQSATAPSNTGNNVAIGYSSVAGDNGTGSAVAVGDGATAQGNESVAIGKGSSSDGLQGVALGRNTSATGDRSFALGAGAVASNNDRGVLQADEVDLEPSSGTQSRFAARDSLGNKRFIATIIEEVNTNLSSGAAVAIPDPEDQSINFIVLDANTTITLPAPKLGARLTVVPVQDGTGGRTIAWATLGLGMIRWPGGVTPTMTATANESDVYNFMSANGSDWWGSVVGQAYP